MKAKILSLVLILVVACLSYLNWPAPQTVINHNNTESLPVDSIENSNHLTPDLIPKAEKPAAPPERQRPAQQNTLLNEISNRLFSDDPYVELYSLDLMIGLCQESLVLPELFKTNQTFIYPKQQELIETIEAKCQNHQANYPQLIGMSRQQRLSAFTATSRLGQLLQQKKNYRHLSAAERHVIEKNILTEAIATQNSAVVIASSYLQGYGPQFADSLSAVTNSRDRNYHEQISRLALINMACQFSNFDACDSSGVVMVVICTQQPESCGLDFPTWYRQNTLPGMRNDVTTLIDFYRNLSQGG